jgi:hypothetical protein
MNSPHVSRGLESQHREGSERWFQAPYFGTSSTSLPTPPAHRSRSYVERHQVHVDGFALHMHERDADRQVEAPGARAAGVDV